MIYSGKQLRTDVVLMIWDSSKIGKQEIKINSKHELNVGDVLKCGSTENPVNYELMEIKGSRPSSISGYKYVTAVANRTTK